MERTIERQEMRTWNPRVKGECHGVPGRWSAGNEVQGALTLYWSGRDWSSICHDGLQQSSNSQPLMSISILAKPAIDFFTTKRTQF